MYIRRSVSLSGFAYCDCDCALPQGIYLCNTFFPLLHSIALVKLSSGQLGLGRLSLQIMNLFMPKSCESHEIQF